MREQNHVSILDLNVPSVNVFAFTVLDGPYLLVQFQCYGSNLIGIGTKLPHFGFRSRIVCDGTDRCQYDRCPDRKNFIQIIQFIQWDGSFLNVQTLITCDIHECLVGNGWQYRIGIGCHIHIWFIVGFAVFDPNKITGREFFYSALCRRIQIQTNWVSCFFTLHVR